MRTAIALLSTGAVVAALLTATPTSTGASATPAGTTGSTAGRYVVLLRAAPAASQHGGNAGQLDARSAAVRRYTAQLRQTHRTVARSYGATPVADLTMASNGFIADLTARQATELAADRRVLMVERSRAYPLATWHTPTVLGLTGASGAWAAHGGEERAGDGVVVGMLDSGVWPESTSVRGAALTTSPKTPWHISRTGGVTRMEKADGSVFRGECRVADDWDRDACSTKIISARYFVDNFLHDFGDLGASEYRSARDSTGHGSHTASIAAGDAVAHATTAGYRLGALSGMAPAARLAVYKVCWSGLGGGNACDSADVLQAVDQAVIDGVDVLNFSIDLGPSPGVDAADVAFAGAAEAGVFIATAAGNLGDAGTINHAGPWLTTVAATTAYDYENTLVLGDGTQLVGASLADDRVPATRLVGGRLCAPGSLSRARVAGRIVVCTRGVYDRVAKSAEVKRAGGIAMVLVNPDEDTLDADFHPVPTVHLSDTDGDTVLAYLHEARANARAAIRVGNRTASRAPVPQVASFSSRGPSPLAGGDLLKPDISAPGVDVLAAVAPPADLGRDYDFKSGTSMAAPHISGLAAFIQGVHPRWTPMRIKSAMMTTATPTRTADDHASTDALAQGAGEVTPRRFFDPGLFVTSGPDQWRGLLTGLGLDTGVPALDPKDVNLPSLADGSVTGVTTFHRTFRAARAGTWTIDDQVAGFDLEATPATVVADRAGELVDVTFTFSRTTAPMGEYAQGAVLLRGPTTVRMPVALLPLSVVAPLSVSGTGTEGSVTVPLTPGATGSLDVAVHGLVAPDTVSGTMSANDDRFECVTVTDGTTLARFGLDAADDDADLDLYVYRSGSCDRADIVGSVGESVTTGDESLTLRDPEPGTYLVEITGFSLAAGASVDFDLHTWEIDPTALAGDLMVTPDPVPAVRDQPTSVVVDWSGLAAGTRYLGYLAYPDAQDITLLEVDTR